MARKASGNAVESAMRWLKPRSTLFAGSWPDSVPDHRVRCVPLRRRRTVVALERCEILCCIMPFISHGGEPAGVGTRIPDRGARSMPRLRPIPGLRSPLATAATVAGTEWAPKKASFTGPTGYDGRTHWHCDGSLHRPLSRRSGEQTTRGSCRRGVVGRGWRPRHRRRGSRRPRAGGFRDVAARSVDRETALSLRPFDQDRDRRQVLRQCRRPQAGHSLPGQRHGRSPAWTPRRWAKSVYEGTNNLDAAIRNTKGPMTVVGLSQGSEVMDEEQVRLAHDPDRTAAGSNPDVRQGQLPATPPAAAVSVGERTSRSAVDCTVPPPGGQPVQHGGGHCRVRHLRRSARQIQSPGFRQCGVGPRSQSGGVHGPG